MAKTETRQQRQLPVGADPVAQGGVHFRVWAPRRRLVEVVFEGDRGSGPAPKTPGTVPLEPEGDGYFSGLVREARPGMRYRYRLDGEGPYPDPVSRFQPEGPHGPSEVVDPSAFEWTDGGWKGVGLRAAGGRPGQVIYEMHVGTFTREGTWEAAIRELPELARLGITVLEIMPVADFAGRFGWGYDGVNLFAPTRLYGRPDDMRRLVDAAHRTGLAVILDVVYNHLGPDGNYLKQFAEDYFTDRYSTEWGEAINFDGPGSDPVREYFLANAAYWIREFHLDGLRLDATQNIYDESEDHILAALARSVRAAAGADPRPTQDGLAPASGRGTLLVAENEPQHVKVVRPPEQGGYGLDALWNDDFHHTAMVAMTGRREAYYTDYLGSPQEFISAARWGYLYQGQWYAWQKKRRGTPTFGLHPAVFVNFTQNHDQIANSGRGRRCHQVTAPGLYRALTTLLLLGPGTPMLFQGQEFASSSPFLYFADLPPELSALVRKGREEFLAQFPSLATPEIKSYLADPGNQETFERCKLDFTDREKHAEAYALHRDLLKLRREDPVFRAQRPGGVDGAVLAESAFVLRYFGGGPTAHAGEGDRLLLVNLGRDLHLAVAPEPLLAPLEGKAWRVLWSSEDPRYGGNGTPPLETEAGPNDAYSLGEWRVPGESAIVLQ